MFLYGLSIGGYRSFGEPQFIGPLQQVNVLAGPNNSGKSNVLAFLRDHLHEAVKASGRGQSRVTLGGTDRRLGPGPNKYIEACNIAYELKDEPLWFD